jgi:hypothetical protein
MHADKWGSSWCENTNLKQSILKHETSAKHMSNVVKALGLGTQQTLKENAVRNEVAKDPQKRNALRSLFRIVYFVALHRLANRLFPSLVALTVAEGNDVFKALTKKNAKYLSSTFFTSALLSMGDVLRAEIIEQIKASLFFSIMIDETADISVTEQLALYVRFVDAMGNIRVYLFDLIALEKADGASILVEVLRSLKEARLELKRLIGLASDGAGAMLGKKQGFAARLRKLQPFLIALHCICHRLGTIRIETMCSNCLQLCLWRMQARRTRTCRTASKPLCPPRTGFIKTRRRIWPGTS